MHGAVIQVGARSVRDKFARCPAQRCCSGRRVQFCRTGASEANRRGGPKRGRPLRARLEARDVAEALGYTNPQKAVRDHCKRVRPIGVNDSFTLDRQTLIIPEPDIYRLVMRSRLPEAERFEEWVVIDETVAGTRIRPTTVA